MGKSEKFLKDVSKEAANSNETAFSKLKSLFASNDSDKEKKRKELIERERQRTYDSLKNRPY